MSNKWPSCFRPFRRKKRHLFPQTSWSYLPPPAIDKIVAVLKKTSRWRRDGPSLRQLNRFWCSQINDHIVSIFPDSCRQLMWADVTSLAKFPNLTSLNIERFIPPLDCISDVLRNSSNWSQEAQRGQDSFIYQRPSLERMIWTMADLPRLSHLTVSGDLLYHHRQKRDLWYLLKGITSLEVREKKEPAMDCPAILDSVIEDFPWVKNIDFACPHFLHPSLISKLEVMETVKLREVVTLQPLASISGLASLSLRRLRLEDVDVLEFLPQLTSLTFFVDTRKILKQLSNSHVLSHLTVISMHSVARQREVKEAFFQKCRHLQSLTLEHFRFNVEDVVRHLTLLTKLEMQKCIITDSILFLSQLSQLESLSYVSGFGQEEVMTGMGSVIITLPELRILQLKPVMNDITFSAITKFKKLEVIHVHCGAVSSQAFKELECLPNLRVLSVQFASKALDRSTSLLSLPFLTSLERLSIGSKVATSHLRKHQIENLQRKAPHLTVDLS